MICEWKTYPIEIMKYTGEGCRGGRSTARVYRPHPPHRAGLFQNFAAFILNLDWIKGLGGAEIRRGFLGRESWRQPAHEAAA